MLNFGNVIDTMKKGEIIPKKFQHLYSYNSRVFGHDQVVTNIGVAPDWWTTGETTSDWLNRYLAGCNSGSGNTGVRDIEDPFRKFVGLNLLFSVTYFNIEHILDLESTF